MSTPRIYAMLLVAVAGCTDESVNDAASALTRDLDGLGGSGGALVLPDACDRRPTELAAGGIYTDVAARGGWVYAAEQGTDLAAGRIVRFSRHGGAAETVVDGTNAIRLEAGERELFWLEGVKADGRRLMRAPLEGGAGHEALATTASIFVLDGDWIYLMEPEEIVWLHARSGEVERLPLDALDGLLSFNRTHIVYASEPARGVLAVNRIEKETGLITKIAKLHLAGTPVALAADDNFIHVLTSMELVRVPAAGGTPKPLGALQGANLADLDVDGERVFVADLDGEIDVWSVIPDTLPEIGAELPGAASRLASDGACLFVAVADGGVGRVFGVMR